jgi:hypothetical protein
MFKTLKKEWREIADLEPGERFQIARIRLREWEHGRPDRVVLSIVAACFLLLIGAAFGFLPILPGFVLGVPGLILLFGRTCKGARALDRIEMACRRLGRTRKEKARGDDDRYR